MKTLLWLDDIRNPFIDEEKKVPDIDDLNINWVLNLHQFIKWIDLYGLPYAISFDHDLADEHYTPEYLWDDFDESEKYQKERKRNYVYGTGEDCAKWLVLYCLHENLPLPKIFIHSDNPVGVKWIKEALIK